MKKEQKINNRLVIILFITIIVAALVTSWKVEDYGEKLINKKDTGIDSEKRELYNMLMTSSKEYGFYFNEDINIDNIADDKMLEYVIEQYVFDNNIEMSNELTLCAEETYDSDYISDECLNNIKSSSFKKEDFKQTLINPLTIKLPEGEYYSEIEAPRGLASIYIKSTGEDKPYRLKWRTPSYYSVNLLRNLLAGEYLNDAIAIAGSLDIILPEVDK